MRIMKQRTEVPQLEALRRWPGLGGCTETELRELSKVVDLIELPAGHVLMRAGEPGREAFMIVSGSVAVEIGGEVVATLGPEHFVGEMALLENDLRTATVTTLEPTQALALSKRAFYAVTSQPYVASRLAVELAHRVRQLEGGPSRRG